MTHIDRRAITNGKPKRAAGGPPSANPMTWAQWMHPDHRHRPVTRGEVMAYCEEFGKALRWQERQNRLHRRVWRWMGETWRYLVTPRAAK